MLPLISVKSTNRRVDFYFNRQVSRHLWIYTRKITIAIRPKFHLGVNLNSVPTFAGTKVYSIQLGYIKILFVDWST